MQMEPPSNQKQQFPSKKGVFQRLRRSICSWITRLVNILALLLRRLLRGLQRINTFLLRGLYFTWAILLTCLRSGSFLLLFNIFLYAFDVAIVFIIGYIVDYFIIKAVGLIYDKIIGYDNIIGNIFVFVQNFSNIGSEASYILMLMMVVFFCYRRRDRLQEVAENQQASLKDKMRLLMKDALEAVRDLVFLNAGFLIILLIVIGTLKCILIFPNSDSFTDVFKHIAAGGIAFGYTVAYLILLWGFAKDLFRKLFDIDIWQRLKNFFRIK